jgi:hypothetical protein
MKFIIMLKTRRQFLKIRLHLNMIINNLLTPIILRVLLLLTRILRTASFRLQLLNLNSELNKPAHTHPKLESIILLHF